MKKLIITLLLLSSQLFADNPPAERLRGLFFSIGVGPRFPSGYFGNNSDLGYGINAELAYTDDVFLPIFLFARVGFDQFNGSQNYYQVSEHNNLSVYSLPINAGARYYFPPMAENIFLFMPFVEASANLNLFTKLHQFKESANKSNYTEESSKLGISAGVGISTFLIEILTSYNYYNTNEYLSLDLKVRLPLYVIY